MKFIITESQFKSLIETKVPYNVRRRISHFDNYLKFTLQYLDMHMKHFTTFDDYLEKVIEEIVDRLYHGWFSEMDDTSDEWKVSANFIEQYVLDNFYDKIKNHYNKNKKS